MTFCALPAASLAGKRLQSALVFLMVDGTSRPASCQCSCALQPILGMQYFLPFFVRSKCRSLK